MERLIRNLTGLLFGMVVGITMFLAMIPRAHGGEPKASDGKLYYVIFVIVPDEGKVKFLDAGGREKVFATEEECYAFAAKGLDFVSKLYAPDDVVAICPQLPGTST